MLQVSGGMKGAWGIPPHSRRLCPHFPPVRRKNGQNQQFWQICGFLPPRDAFCPLDAPHKKGEKNLVPPLLRGGIDSGECTSNLASSFRKRYSY